MEISGSEEGTAARIKAAAKRIFMDKGYDGTTMQHIADESGVNKALLHYYFGSKDKLFILVFREELGELSRTMSGIWEDNGLPLGERLEAWIDSLTDLTVRSPTLPIFVIAELSRNPELIGELLAEFKPPVGFLALEGGGRDDVVVPPLAVLIVSVYSLIFFPVIASPLFSPIFGVSGDFAKELFQAQVGLAKELVRKHLAG